MNPKDEVQTTIEYEYDAAGRKKGRTVKTVSGNQVRTEYVWTGDVMTGITVLDSGGAIIKRFALTYGGGNALESESEYDQANALISKTSYTYENGFLTRAVRKNATGGILSDTRYINDDEGNPIEITLNDRAGKPLEIKRQTWQAFTKTVRKN